MEARASRPTSSSAIMTPYFFSKATTISRASTESKPNPSVPNRGAWSAISSALMSSKRSVSIISCFSSFFRVNISKFRNHSLINSGPLPVNILYQRLLGSIRFCIIFFDPGDCQGTRTGRNTIGGLQSLAHLN
jgi:hypothetical protein